jgi:hypothetical protein
MKNPHIKIPPKSPCTNFQSPSIFKNPIFIPKRFFLQILAQPPAGLFGPRSPPVLSSSLTAPAEHRLLLLSHRRAMDAVPSFSRAMEPQRSPPITPPSSIGRSYYPPSLPIMAAMKAPITATAHHSWPPHLPPDPIKGHSHSGGAPHPFTSPPPLPIHTHTVAAWSQSPAAGAPPPHLRPSPDDRSPSRSALRPSRCHPRGKPLRPGAAVRPSSGKPLPSATVKSTVEPGMSFC